MIKIVHDGDKSPDEALAALLQRAAEYAAERDGLPDPGGEVSLLFADPDEIRQLNAEYRGIGEPTDVLSFPMFDNKECILDAAEHRGDGSQPVMLGDIVICGEIGKSRAEECGHSEERELAFLFTHGLLHILGREHGDAMRTAEEEILAELGLERGVKQI